MDVAESLSRGKDGPPHTGHVLGGRYELRGRIASGGMGSVWRALDSVLHREVAVKILKDELVDSAAFLDRFRAEARHAASVSHSGVASVFDYGEDHDGSDRVAYLVMELVRGEPLSTVLHREGALPVDVVSSILSQTADALQAAHDLGVVHRDVKPGNLLLVGGTTVKVTDFGISVAIDSAPLTEPGQVVGTAQYMAPEQALGRVVTPASDIYALGVIGHEMLAGRPPFTDGTAAAISSAHVHRLPPPLPMSVPDDLRNLLSESMSKDAADRPASARVFAARVRQISSELPLRAASNPALAETCALASVASPVATSVENVVTEVCQWADTQTAIMPSARAPDVEPLIDMGVDARVRKRRRSYAVAVSLAIAITILVARHSPGNSALATARARAAAAASAAVAGPATVAVTAAALINFSATDVDILLTSQGLVVRQSTVDAPGTPAGLVVAVTPEGALNAGTTVVLSVSDGDPAAPPAAPGSTGTAKGGKGKGNGKD